MSPKNKKKGIKNEEFTLTQGHIATLSAVPTSFTGIDVFGKVVEPVFSNLPDLHQMAEIFGYREQGACIRFPVSERISLPAPDGPADGCGWDPSQFVVWKGLPRGLVTKQMDVRTTTLHEVTMAAKIKAGLTAERTVDDVLHDWLIKSIAGQPIPDLDQLQVAWSTMGSGGALTPQDQQNLANLLNREFGLNPKLVVANLPGTLTVGQLKLNLHRSA